MAYYGLTEEESELIRATIVLPMVLSIVEKSKQTLEGDKLGLKKLYLIATEVLSGRIQEEIARVKKELWKNQIKVIVSNSAEPLKYAFACRGLTNNLVMAREEARLEIGERLGAFVSKLMTELGQTAQ